MNRTDAGLRKREPKEGSMSMSYLRNQPTPAVITALLARLPDAERPQREEELKLSFYFSDQWVAYRRTEHGPTILAAGCEEQVGAELQRQRVRGTEGNPLVIRKTQPFPELYRGLTQLAEELVVG